MVFHLGTCSAQNPKMSVMRRIDGRGGKMYSFCAMYSLRMSFCRVPEIFFQSAPCCSATTRYIAHSTEAGELMVIDTVVFSRSMPLNKISMSSRESMATPHLPTSPSLAG